MGSARAGRFGTHGIRGRLILSFLLSTLLLCLASIYTYISINSFARTINATYESNLRMMDLSSAIDGVQLSVEAYLELKSPKSLGDYYRYQDDLLAISGNLNAKVLDGAIPLLERSIRNMIATYLDSAERAVQAKRARNVELYVSRYDEATRVYGFLERKIDHLNGLYFAQNHDYYRAMSSALRYIELNNLILLGFIVVINTALIFWLTYKITTPLVELAEMADEVGQGKFDQEPIRIETDDEVGVVAAAFNRMIVSINGYIEKIRESAVVESRLREHDLVLTNYYKDAQLRSLQAQINPHFLFNTLNAGMQLAMMEGADDTCSFIEKVADFFRYNIKKLNRNATLREELALVDSYAYILKVRLADHITFRKSIDESCLDVDLPGMTLQPLVENALVHGLADSEQGGTIDIVVERAPTHVLVRVRDDGRGMTRERIENILADREDAPALSPLGAGEELPKGGRAGSSTGIGLRNVITRLRLFYGLDDIVNIKSEGPGTGTEIQIRIPTNDDGGSDV